MDEVNVTKIVWDRLVGADRTSYRHHSRMASVSGSRLEFIAGAASRKTSIEPVYICHNLKYEAAIIALGMHRIPRIS